MNNVTNIEYITGGYRGYSKTIHNVSVSIYGTISCDLNGSCHRKGWVSFNTSSMDVLIESSLSKFVLFLNKKNIVCDSINIYGDMHISEGSDLPFDTMPHYFLCCNKYMNQLFKLIISDNTFEIEFISENQNENELLNILKELDLNILEGI